MHHASPATDRESEANTPSIAIKRLQPGAPGTKRLLKRFGPSLLCVRYRLDPASGRRFTTVELVVEERPAKASADVLVRIAYNETELRSQVKNAGGVWEPEHKLWRIATPAVKALGLEKRIVK